MAKKLEELLGMHSIESQNRIFEMKIILNDLVKEDIQLLKLAEEAKNDETVKMSLKELRARVHKNRA